MGLSLRGWSIWSAGLFFASAYSGLCILKMGYLAKELEASGYVGLEAA